MLISNPPYDESICFWTAIFKERHDNKNGWLLFMVQQTGSYDHVGGQTMHLNAIVFSVIKLLMNILRANLFLILKWVELSLAIIWLNSNP